MYFVVTDTHRDGKVVSHNVENLGKVMDLVEARMAGAHPDVSVVKVAHIYEERHHLIMECYPFRMIKSPSLRVLAGY